MCNERIYRIWANMKYRCNAKSGRQYKYYGSKGITVCKEWLDFINFYNWAIKNGYKKGLELDRIDNDGNYEPSNCQWITHKENNNKRGNNRLLIAFGETHTLAEWAEIKNISDKTLTSRLRRGWNVEKALTISTRKTINKREVS